MEADERAKIRIELLQELKNAKTYEDFQKFMKKISDLDGRLVSKKRRCEAYDFRHLYKCKSVRIAGLSLEQSYDHFCDDKYIDRVTYCFNDGYTNGESYVKYLYRSLDIVI